MVSIKDYRAKGWTRVLSAMEREENLKFQASLSYARGWEKENIK